jgi:HK97 family phage portal protein
MGLVQRILNAVSVAGVNPSNPSNWLVRMFGGAGSSSGIVITESNALTVSDVYKCVRVLSEAVAMLPWNLYRRLPVGREIAESHPLYPVLHAEPNDHMTSFVYRECMMAHLLLWGKHASYIERNPVTGKVVALWPIRPDRFRPQLENGEIWWYVRTDNGQEGKYFDDEILYIPALTSDGFNAYSPIRLHAEALGLSKATEVFGAKFFGNGSRPSGFLSHPGTLKKETKRRLKEEFEEMHRGVDHAHRLAVLEEGLKFEKMSIPPDEAQFLETRKFQRTEISGLFRVPPHKISDLERGTFSNIEQQNLEFYTDAVIPWLERIEQAGNRKLLMPSEKKKYYNKFLVKGMLRGDTAARTQHYKDMFDRGVYSENTILEMEDENPVPGGDRRYIPMNMVPVDLVDQIFAPKEKPAEPDTLDARLLVRQACTRFFRDATGRVLKRKKAERQKYAESAFLQPVLAVIECILGRIPADSQQFADAFSAQIAAKSANWEGYDPQPIAAEVLGNTMEAVLKERFTQ